MRPVKPFPRALLPSALGGRGRGTRDLPSALWPVPKLAHARPRLHDDNSPDRVRFGLAARGSASYTGPGPLGETGLACPHPGGLAAL